MEVKVKVDDGEGSAVESMLDPASCWDLRSRCERARVGLGEGATE